MTEALKWKLICCAIVAVVLIGIGFFIGRKTVKIPAPETVTEYITLPPVHDSIPYPKPVYVQKPIDTAKIIQQCIADGIYQELWPEKIVEIDKNDTTAIMADWATKRRYAETIFDVDTLGKCEINAEVQYNRLKMVGYTFTPVEKVVTNTIYQQNFLLGISGGAYFKDRYGVNVQYQHSVYDETSYLGGGFSIKF